MDLQAAAQAINTTWEALYGRLLRMDSSVGTMMLINTMIMELTDLKGCDSLAKHDDR